MALPEILNYIEDDWDDNALTNRTDNTEGYFLHPSDGLLSGDFEAGDALKGVYRPEWLEEINSLAVQNGRLEWSQTGDGEVMLSTPSDFSIGEFQMDAQYTTLGNDQDGIFLFILREYDSGGLLSASADYLGIQLKDGSDNNFQYYKSVGGSRSTIIVNSWPGDTNTYTIKGTRGPYGSLELILDGVSQGTATDTYTPPEPTVVSLDFYDSGGGSEANVDNLVIQ